MNSIIPKHIPHDLQDTTSSKSSIYWMGILLKNEASYSNCIQIMEEYENLISRWYTQSGRGNINNFEY